MYLFTFVQETPVWAPYTWRIAKGSNMAVTNEQIEKIASYFFELARGATAYRDSLYFVECGVRKCEENGKKHWLESCPEKADIPGDVFWQRSNIFWNVAQLLQSVSQDDEAGVFDAKDTLKDYVPEPVQKQFQIVFSMKVGVDADTYEEALEKSTEAMKELGIGGLEPTSHTVKGR